LSLKNSQTCRSGRKSAFAPPRREFVIPCPPAPAAAAIFRTPAAFYEGLPAIYHPLPRFKERCPQFTGVCRDLRSPARNFSPAAANFSTPAGKLRRLASIFSAFARNLPRLAANFSAPAGIYKKLPQSHLCRSRREKAQIVPNFANQSLVTSAPTIFKLKTSN
jgi:hypothetical protein